MINLKNPFSLVNKTILITGASSGIGKSIAIESSQMGAKLILLGRNSERLMETMSLLSGEGHNIKAMDLNNSEEVSVFVAELPKLDGIVFCAGTQKTAMTRFLLREELDEVFETNFFSAVNLNQLLLSKKKINKEASIVFISSTAAGLVAEYGNAAYSASKGALTSYSKVLALELSSQKTRVNVVSPGLVKTPLLDKISVDSEQLKEDEKRYPLGYGNPEDVAFAVIYLLSDASRWITGTTILLDGGLTLK
jgi:NAD(P)-dependent dehydrogenase (short-subunit alcohol dehydrogenase family)